MSYETLKQISEAMILTMDSYVKTGTKVWDERIAIQDLAYQTGGILKLDMQLNNERHKQGKTEAQLKDDLEMELAEVIGLSLYIAHKMNLNVVDGFERMLSVDKEKVQIRSQEGH